MSDLEAIEKTVADLYAAISGPVGAPRDWDLLRSVMTEDGTMTPVSADGPNCLDVEGYRQRTESFLIENGFFEVETSGETDILGDVAQRWSNYEGRTGAVDGPVFTVGTNSVQLIKQEGRWRVFSLLWPSTADPNDKIATMEANEE